jgi:hypothetical protein
MRSVARFMLDVLAAMEGSESKARSSHGGVVASENRAVWSARARYLQIATVQ